MESIIFSSCLIGGAIIGGLIFDDFGGLVGLLVGGYIGVKLVEQYKGSNQSKNKERESSYNTDKDSSVTHTGGVVSTFVVGVSFEGRQAIIEKLAVNDILYLVREFNNPHDKNAIKVLAPRKSDNKIELTKENAYRVSLSTGIPIEEYYVMDQVGYINRNLASQIAPVFDKYAWGPNRFVKAKVLKITSGVNKPKGIQIEFDMPTAYDLEIAKTESMNSITYY